MTDVVWGLLMGLNLQSKHLKVVAMVSKYYFHQHDLPDDFGLNSYFQILLNIEYKNHFVKTKIDKSQQICFQNSKMANIG